MARQGRITEKFVAKLEPPETGQRIEWDNYLPGFGYRLTSNGAGAFVFSYYLDGVKHLATIGRVPAWSATSARERAKVMRQMVDQGIDPLAPNHEGKTVKDLADEYVKRHLPTKRASSADGDKRMLNGVILPKLGKKVLTEISKRDIEALHQSMRSVPYRANRILALLSTMFAKAEEWEYVDKNPCKGVKKYSEERREAWLTKEQVKALEKALDRHRDQQTANIFRLLLLTGSRAGEVMGARWEQFDLPRGIWTKPAHTVKQNSVEHIPLSSAALAVLTKMAKRKPKSEFLFPSSNGNGKSRTSVARFWRSVSRTAGLSERVEVQGRRKTLVRWKPKYRIHDLRHNFCSHLVSAGVSLPIIGALVGHRLASTTQRYAHVSQDAQRQAVERFPELIK